MATKQPKKTAKRPATKKTTAKRTAAKTEAKRTAAKTAAASEPTRRVGLMALGGKPATIIGDDVRVGQPAPHFTAQVGVWPGYDTWAEIDPLAATAGTYDLRITSWHEPGGPAVEDTGTATRAMVLGGRVLVEEVESSMMGMPFTGRGTTGFDNVSGKYWATWNDSMSTGIMVSEGTCDTANKTCSFTGSWNDALKKGPVTARMTTRWTSPTTEVFELYGPGKDGKEMKMMEILYTKK